MYIVIKEFKEKNKNKNTPYLFITVCIICCNKNVSRMAIHTHFALSLCSAFYYIDKETSPPRDSSGCSIMFLRWRRRFAHRQTRAPRQLYTYSVFQLLTVSCLEPPLPAQPSVHLARRVALVNELIKRRREQISPTFTWSSFSSCLQYCCTHLTRHFFLAILSSRSSFEKLCVFF